MDKKTKNIKPETTKPYDIFLTALLIITALVFSKGLSYDILNFDDKTYMRHYKKACESIIIKTTKVGFDEVEQWTATKPMIYENGILKI